MGDRASRILMRRSLRVRDNSGVILLSVLWILSILSVLCLALGRSASVEMALTKYALGNVKSYAAARAGIIYSMQLIKIDAANNETSKFDTLLQCGLSIEQGSGSSDLLKNIKVGDDSHFDIGFSTQDTDTKRLNYYYGLQDEERKINLNALNVQNHSILSQLIVQFGFDQSLADIIAASVVDWHDIDNLTTKSFVGAETKYYEDLLKSYHCKNAPFEQIEELLFVRGMTLEIFEKIKDFLTVYPQKGDLRVNLNTASPEALRSVISYLIDVIPGMSVDNPGELVQKIIHYRNGDDRAPLTDDDRSLPLQGNIKEELNLTSPEFSLYSILQQQYGTVVSNYFRVNIRGLDEESSIATHLEAIIQRADLSIVYWKRH